MNEVVSLLKIFSVERIMPFTLCDDATQFAAHQIGERDDAIILRQALDGESSAGRIREELNRCTGIVQGVEPREIADGPDPGRSACSSGDQIDAVADNIIEVGVDEPVIEFLPVLAAIAGDEDPGKVGAGIQVGAI